MSKKKPLRKKKIVKRVRPRSIKPVSQGVMAVIPYDQIAKPELYKGKFTLTPTHLNEVQIKAIVSQTPQNVIKDRPGRGGKSFKYIPGWWFKKRLNFIFGFDGWDTIIDGERIDGDFITVKGRLIIHDAKTGKDIVSKTDYGGADIKYLKDKPHKPEHYLDITNDFKAAQTDLVKRCCVQLGMAMDVYGIEESSSSGQNVGNSLPPALPPHNPIKGELKEGQVMGPEGSPVYLCSVGGEIISEAEYKFSKNTFKRALCREHQKNGK